jgi:phospholipid/cholesterol/gamma-HCH transport system substrate-binding protein
MSRQANRDRMILEMRRARGGLAALLGLIVLSIGAAYVIADGLRLNMPWSDTYTARVAVDDAKGVVAGKQQVRISGLPVGKITKAELVDGQPVLTLTIKGEYGRLYHDARLRLRPKTPLNDLYLNVEDRGTKSAGELSEDQVLRAERTRAPVDIGRVLNTFDSTTRVRMEQTIDEVGRGLGDRGDDFRAALVELAPFLNAARRLTHETAIRRTQTKRLVHNLTLMMGELGRRDDDLHKLVVGGAHTFSELAAQDAALSDVIAQFPPTLQQLLPTFATLRKTADELDPALDALQPAARSLPGALANLRDFSLEANPSLAALRRPVPDLTRLVHQLRPTAEGLDRAFTRLQPQAPRLDRITAKVVPCEYAVSKFFHNTLSLMKFADARGLVPRGQTVDGNSLFQRQAKSCAPGGPRK